LDWIGLHDARETAKLVPGVITLCTYALRDCIFSGINSLILSIRLASHVSTHLLIHLSAHLYYHHHSHRPSLLHSITLCSKPTFSTNPSHLRLFFTYRTAFMTTGLDRTYHAHHFIFSFTLYFFVYSVWWTKLATRQLFTAR